MRWRIAEWAVTVLRAWYGLRERVGRPRRVPVNRFGNASDTVLLAGSPWVMWPTTSSAAPGQFYVTNTTWPSRFPKSKD